MPINSISCKSFKLDTSIEGKYSVTFTINAKGGTKMLSDMIDIIVCNIVKVTDFTPDF